MSDEIDDRDSGDDLPEYRHQADDPTAVWDEDSLRAAGISDLLEEVRSAATGPATPPPSEAGRASVELSEDMSPDELSGEKPKGSRAEAPVDLTDPGLEAAPTRRGGLSWPVTIVLAVAVGGAVYALVTLLR